MSSFADRFKELKQLKNVTYDEIGAVLNLKRRAVQTYADGTRRPDYDGLIALADYFDVSIDYLVGRSDDPRRH
ncbi:helix-turn-helix domain-containing protein [Paenibacillus popilliae]|uniref:Predicted transcriptional regulator n=1 Tax=Paenibacillus popilliae ATCC 14706 TaxID=1212764 RepID=M9LLS5_PAEPP|nr:helix-turn-helix transcriptional regulator [Paenibacillus popilliae]GAC44275.1 predicted transcriptional regulator [Paenibacillus popilliae ATCC 14706]